MCDHEGCNETTDDWDGIERDFCGVHENERKRDVVRQLLRKHGINSDKVETIVTDGDLEEIFFDQ